MRLFIHLLVCLSMHRSICLSVCLSVCLSLSVRLLPTRAFALGPWTSSQRIESLKTQIWLDTSARFPSRCTLKITAVRDFKNGTSKLSKWRCKRSFTNCISTPRSPIPLRLYNLQKRLPRISETPKFLFTRRSWNKIVTSG